MLNHQDDADAKNTFIQRAFASTKNLYGAAAFEKIMQAKVAIIGIGGVGSWSAEALARLGCQNLLLVDADIITIGNTNRQIHTTQQHYGHSKVGAMQARLQSMSPYIKVDVVDDFINANNISHLDACPYIIDACDDFPAKMQLVHYCLAHPKTLVIAGSAGGKTAASSLRLGHLLEATHDKMLAKMRYHLRKTHAEKVLKKLSVVYSSQSIQRGVQACEPQAKLACSGYGSSVLLTATMGMLLVERVVNHMVNSLPLSNGKAII